MSMLKFTVRLAIGAALVAYLVREHEVQFQSVAERMLQIPLGALLAALCLDLAGQTLSAFRWSRISALGGNPVSFARAWPVYFSGMFFNICLPTSIGGDVVRVVGLGQQVRSKTAALASVFMDRNVGLAALLALGFCSSLAVATTIQVTISTFSPEPIVLPLWPFFLVLILGFVAANAVLFDNRTYDWAERLLLRRLPRSVGEKIAKLHGCLQVYRRPLSEFAWTFFLSLCYQASEAALVWVLARGLGVDLSFWVFGSLVMFQAVAGLLPITINNIGVREGIFCAVLLGQAAAMGMGQEQIKDSALALSLLYFGVIVCSGLCGGLVYLVSGLRKPTAAEVAEAALPAAVVESSGGGQ